MQHLETKLCCRLQEEEAARKVLAVPATSASPERMFSVAGHILNKQRANLSPDHMEELVYLHEVWPTVREWEAVKRARH